MKNKINIIFIDSGIAETHPVFAHILVKKISLCSNNSISDDIGHGTAVASIVARNCEHIPIVITMIKVFGTKDEINDIELLNAMKYIWKENIDGDIINISCGVNRTARMSEFDEVSKALARQGRIIISAFSPISGITYPAACDHVIGVDISSENFRPGEYIYSENSPITIRGSAYPVRVAVPSGGFANATGSSFSCAYFTSVVANYLHKNPGATYNEVCTQLRDNAAVIKKFHTIEKTYHPPIKSIKNVALFPYNKEMHSLVSFAELLPFSINTVYDLKYNRKVGTKTSEYTPKYYSNNNYTIENIDSIHWDIDTMILGNMSKLSMAVKHNLKRKLVLECLKRGVNVYSFDKDGIDENIIREFNSSGRWCYVPEVTSHHVITNLYGRMHHIALPVLGIFGTSPKQGKFTLQLLLRRWFMIHGYNIGQLGTEPSSLLFGMDEVYNIGLHSTVDICGIEAIQYVNNLAANMQRGRRELLIVGSQSQTTLNGEGNVGFVPSAQYEMLMGTQPDAVILCVNYFDDIYYISRTILYIESSIDCKVIALVVFPCQYDNYQGHLIGIAQPIERRLLDQKCRDLSTRFNIHAEVLSNDCEKLGQLVISFFDKRDQGRSMNGLE